MLVLYAPLSACVADADATTLNDILFHVRLFQSGERGIEELKKLSRDKLERFIISGSVSILYWATCVGIPIKEVMSFFNELVVHLPEKCTADARLQGEVREQYGEEVGDWFTSFFPPLLSS